MNLTDTLHPEIRIRDIRKVFGVIAGLLLILGGLRWVYGDQRTFLILAALAMADLILILLAPRILTPLYRLWLPLARGIGWLNTHLFLLLVYYLLFSPLSFMMRMAGRDSLALKDIRNGRCSWWPVEDQTGGNRERYTKQF